MARMMRIAAHGIRVSASCILLLLGSLVVSIPRSVQDIQGRVAAQVHPEAPAPSQAADGRVEGGMGGVLVAAIGHTDTVTAKGIDAGAPAAPVKRAAPGDAHAAPAPEAPDPPVANASAAGGPAAPDVAPPPVPTPAAEGTAGPDATPRPDAAPLPDAPAPSPGAHGRTASDAGSSAPPVMPMAKENMVLGVTSTRLVSQITGLDAAYPTGGWGVHGTDLGHMFWHRGNLYMVFGDTFGEGGREQGRYWRSNVLARVTPPVLPEAGIRVQSMITGPNGFAREVLSSMKVDGIERTVIPTNGISTGDRMFLHYMSIRTWHRPGRWDVGHSGLAYSDDDGVTWMEPARATWPGKLGFEQVAFVRHEGHVYSFGIPAGRYGDVKLRRVDEDRMLDPLAYEYWTESGWASAPEAAVAVAPAPAGELSVAWNAAHGKWMMMYLHPAKHAVVLRLAPELTGPWSPEQVVVSGQDQPGLYAPYIVPLHDIGEEVLFTLSKWAPYNVYLMRMTLGGVAGAAH